MKQFAYLVTEGVLDVVFLTQVLRAGFGFVVIDRKSNLPQQAADWLGNFKWPVADDISRLAVPAPVFLQRDDCLVSLRNAKGTGNIQKILQADQEAFFRFQLRPQAIGIVLDADDLPPSERFSQFANLLSESNYPRPQSLEAIILENGVRSGIFSFPGKGMLGTIEDVLLPLGLTRFPRLAHTAGEYVESWIKNDAAGPSDDFRELRKPAGSKKAKLSAMAAVLKPAKSLNASMEDQKWIPAQLDGCAELMPLIEFLRNLLAFEVTGVKANQLSEKEKIP